MQPPSGLLFRETASPDRTLEVRPQSTDGSEVSPYASSPVALLHDLVEGWRVLGRSDLEAAARMAPVIVADWSRPQLCPTYLQAVAAGSWSDAHVDNLRWAVVAVGDVHRRVPRRHRAAVRRAFLADATALLLGAGSLLCVVPAARGGWERASA